jgi:hypothetical protein
VFKSKPKMKKRTKKIIFIIIGILVLLFLFRTIYKNFDFEKDKQTFVALITKAGTGKVVDALDEMRELESLTNPITKAGRKKCMLVLCPRMK